MKNNLFLLFILTSTCAVSGVHLLWLHNTGYPQFPTEAVWEHYLTTFNELVLSVLWKISYLHPATGTLSLIYGREIPCQTIQWFHRPCPTYLRLCTQQVPYQSIVFWKLQLIPLDTFWEIQFWIAKNFSTNFKIGHFWNLLRNFWQFKIEFLEKYPVEWAVTFRIL